MNKNNYPVAEQSCSTCWWLWYSINSDVCHNNEARIINDDNGEKCPWYKPGLKVKNEQHEPIDIWN